MRIQAHHIFIKDYDYGLPPHRIAEFPLPERDHSKLLIYQNGIIRDDHFLHLDSNLPQGCTLVLNNTRVIEARILFQKQTGGLVEIFCLEPFHERLEKSLSASGSVQWKCLIGGASKWKTGQILKKEVILNSEVIQLEAKYVAKQSDSFIIEFLWQTKHSFSEVLHAAGAIPLPPYIKRTATDTDRERYQTIFSKEEGSVAAPTAALHFTKAVFQKIAQKNIDVTYITLHVGAGTFKPVKTETVAEHEMHKEPFTVSLNALQKIVSSEKIVAVGTTALRTLESLYWLGIKLINNLLEDEWVIEQWEVYELVKKYTEVSTNESLNALINWMEKNNLKEIHCRTGLIIVPGYQFKIPDALITNFHQPQSTLLLLVSAFIGEDWKKIYAHALENDYRFLSYGDSSLLWRRPI